MEKKCQETNFERLSIIGGDDEEEKKILNNNELQSNNDEWFDSENQTEADETWKKMIEFVGGRLKNTIGSGE